MCGLVAVVNFHGRDAQLAQLKRMTDIIRHRGPDDDGHYVSGPVGLGFRRLSILDLTPAGHQPMASADGQVVLVFNGEIYNYVELRRELESLGHRFQSSGDTAVLLHAYLQWGADCVDRLNGMWAFIIHDCRRNLLFGSRDRFGIKPLYRCVTRERMLFASEIKAIRASGSYTSATNWAVASDFLLRGRLDESPHSFYQGIEQVGAGCSFELSCDGRYREWRYWSLDSLQPGALADPAHAYAELFEDAVRLHMRSDVPVAVHLSGGLDSTAIICASARIREQASAADPLRAFCFASKDFDESVYVEATLAQTHAQMELLDTGARKLWDDLPRLLWYQDEPVHSMTATVGFELMQLTAARGLKVVLNGQGADETAAGYPSYFVNYWHSLLRSGHWGKAWAEIGAYSATRNQPHIKTFAQQVIFLARNQAARLPAYRRVSRARAARQALDHPWLSADLAAHLSQQDDAVPDYRLWPTLAKSVQQSPLPIYLRVEDRNSSANSVEVRVPFLDYRLVEMLFQLPDDWRMRGPWNKYVQREGMRDKIPEVVRARVDKMGFPTPAQKWFAGPLYEPLRDLLGSQQTRERGIFKVDRLLADLDRHHRGEGAMAAQVFDLAEFELWCRQSEREQQTLPPS